MPHDLPVTAVAATQDNSKILNASADKNVRVWDLGNINTPEYAKELELTLDRHDGTIIVVLPLKTNDSVITTGADKTIKVWDSMNGKVVKSLPIPTGGQVLFCCLE